MRRWVRRVAMVSLVLFLVTALYWAFVSAFVTTDFRHLSGSDPISFESVLAGRTEVVWVVDRQSVLVFVLRGEAAVPLVGQQGPVNVLFSPDTPVRWEDDALGKSRRGWLLPGVAEMLSFAGVGRTTGRAATIRIVWAPLWKLAVMFGVVPGVWTFWRWRRLPGYWRARRRRRMRGRLSRCRCGYDLRETRGRCPECGRAVRWVPVVVGR